MALELKPDLSVFRTPNGIIQVVIWFICLIGFAVLASWGCSVSGTSFDYSDVDGGSFLLAMLVVAWLVSFALAVVYLLAFEKLAQLPFSWWLLVASFSASWSLMSIIASSVVAKELDDFDDRNGGRVCKVGALRFATAMGFFSTFSLAAAAVFAFLEFQKKSGDEEDVVAAEPEDTTPDPHTF
eukprot:m.22889 g.22889  ORF g.22889 m.22889 type:complete len:183 (-) comp11302_c0_seq5:789-1337(-)